MPRNCWARAVSFVTVPELPLDDVLAGDVPWLSGGPHMEPVLVVVDELPVAGVEVVVVVVGAGAALDVCVVATACPTPGMK
jgi:hypothetical protein